MSTKLQWLELPKRDVLRAAQAAYYVLKNPFISDYDFDRLEKDYEKETGRCLPVGSDNKQDYTEPEWALALYFAFRHLYYKANTEPKPMAAEFGEELRRKRVERAKAGQGFLNL
jgi:hypothetical protein